MPSWSASSAAIPERAASTSCCWKTATLSIRRASSHGRWPRIRALLAPAVLASWAPLDLVAAPSGYGLPVWCGATAFTEDHLEQMSLVRPDQRGTGHGRHRLSGLGPGVSCDPARRLFSCRADCTCRRFPLIARQMRSTWGRPTRSPWRRWRSGSTARESGGFDRSTFAVVEVGSAFSAILVVERGRLVDASAGTRGPIGLRSGGSWDGEVAYWRGPLSKDDLFRGGLADLGPIGPDAFRESLIKHLAGLQAVTPFERIYLSGKGLEAPEIAAAGDARRWAGSAGVTRLPRLPGAWVKHAAQGSAILADALAGGRFAPVARSLQITSAAGSVWDVLGPPER